MKTQLSLKALAEKIEENQRSKKDYIATTDALEVTDAGPQGYKLNIANGVTENFGINDHSHRQIASRLDIPSKYYNRMRKQAPEIYTRSVNHWLHDRPERRLVRTLGGDVRAFLSDRYQRIENEQIAEVVLPILADIPDVQFVSTAVTETRMYIKAVTPRIQADVSIGDTVQAGLAISNSEVGAGAVKIEPLVYRLVCNNGLVLNDATMRANHVGSRIGDQDKIAHLLSDEAIKADDNAILLKVRDVVRAAITQESLDQAVVKMRHAKNERIEGDVPTSIEVLSNKMGFSKQEGSGVFRYLIEGGDISRYGVLNAITRYSQDVEDYDRATELEAAGGIILDMKPKDWREISEGA